MKLNNTHHSQSFTLLKNTFSSSKNCFRRVMLMGSSPFPKWLFLFLLHAFLLSSTTESSTLLLVRQGNELINATCKVTGNFNLCTKALGSDPRSFKSDVKGLAKISLEMSLTKANQTLNLVGDLFKNTREPVLFRLLGTCIEEYRQAVTNYLPEAMSALQSNNYGASKQGAENAAADAQVCVQQFAGRKSPVRSRSKMVKALCLIASSIVSTLQ